MRTRRRRGFTDRSRLDREASLATCWEMNPWMSSPSARKSLQLRPDSLHKEPTVLWLCGGETKFRGLIFSFKLLPGLMQPHALQQALNIRPSDQYFLPFVCIEGAVFQKSGTRLFPQGARISLIHCDGQRAEVKGRSRLKSMET